MVREMLKNMMEQDDLQSREWSNESRHERERVQDVASIGDTLLVDNLKVGVVVGVPAAVLETAISKVSSDPRDLPGLTRSTGT